MLLFSNDRGTKSVRLVVATANLCRDDWEYVHIRKAFEYMPLTRSNSIEIWRKAYICHHAVMSRQLLPCLEQSPVQSTNLPLKGIYWPTWKHMDIVCGMSTIWCENMTGHPARYNQSAFFTTFTEKSATFSCRFLGYSYRIRPRLSSRRKLCKVGPAKIENCPSQPRQAIRSVLPQIGCRCPGN